jgi:hypothetical protein
MKWKPIADRLGAEPKDEYYRRGQRVCRKRGFYPGERGIDHALAGHAHLGNRGNMYLVGGHSGLEPRCYPRQGS